MDPKLLTENGWKATAQKFKIKDNGLQRALSVYEKLADDKHDDRLKGIASVSQMAGALKKDKEVAAVPDVVKYLTNLLAAAQSEQREITQAKDQAGKKAEAEAKKQEQEQKQKAGQDGHAGDEDEEEETGDSFEKLTKALQTLKTSKVPYYFLFCKDKPYGLIVSKKDITKSAQHKKELAKMAGGSTSPPKFGQCSRESSKLIFEMDKPVPGMARILQKWIKESTGLGLKVMVGTESADDDEGQPAAAGAGAAAKPAAPKPAKPALEKAPEVWRQTQRAVKANIDQLKAAVRKAFAAEAPKLVAEIEQNMKRLDSVSDKFDDKLAASLAKAYAEKDSANRTAELKNAKTLLGDHIKYVASEPLIAHIDSNPFGVKTNLKQLLTDDLKRMAQAIGV